MAEKKSTGNKSTGSAGAKPPPESAASSSASAAAEAPAQAAALPEQPKGDAAAFGVLAFLIFINVLNFVDRQMIASLAAFIKPELQLSDTEFGLLTGFAFILFYSIAGTFMGALADMVHRPRLLAVGLALWSVCTALTGLARGFMTMAIPRAFIGIGESIQTPTSMSLLADRFPASRMGFAAGAYYMGVPVGVGVSLLIVGYLTQIMHWRHIFFLLGGIGVATALVLWFVPDRRREAEKRLREQQAERDGQPRVGVSAAQFAEMFGVLLVALRASPALTLTISGGVAVHFVLGAGVFEQLWLVEERGFERQYIAVVTGWLFLVGGVAGNLAGGLGSDLFVRLAGGTRAHFLAILLLLLTPITLAYRFAEPGTPFFWLGVMVGAFTLGSLYGPTFSTVQELVPPRIRATVVAFYILTLNLIGLGFGALASGIAVDVMRSSGVPEPYTKVLFTLGVLSALSIPLFWLAGRRYHQDMAALQKAQG